MYIGDPGSLTDRHVVGPGIALFSLCLPIPESDCKQWRFKCRLVAFGK